MRQYAQPVPAPSAKREASAAGAERPKGRPANPKRGAIWHAIQLKAAQSAAPAPGSASRSGLPGSLKAGIERLSGIAMDDVRVHRNSPEPAKLGALAYAQGGDIHLGPGQDQHLPHEAWHVVQQKQGRVRPTFQLKGGAQFNDDSGLELEADAMGKSALASAESTREALGQPARMRDGAGEAVTQCVWVTSPQGALRWDTLLGGLQWFYDQMTEHYHYEIIDELAVPMNIWSRIEALEGRSLQERELLELGFQRLQVDPEEARIEPERFLPLEGAGMVTATVKALIEANLKRGEPPFKPELGLGGCSWFIWKGHGTPYTSIDKPPKGSGEKKNIPIEATIWTSAYPLMITTAFLAERHSLYMTDPEFGRDALRRWLAYKKLAPNKVLNSGEKKDFAFYLKGFAEQQMWVAIGRMVAAHPARVGVVVLQNSDFSKTGNGKFLVVADASKIVLVSAEDQT